MSGYRQKCISKKGEICHICGETRNIVVHHINGNRTNNRLNNLIPVCRYCHVGIHEARENYEHWHAKLLPWYRNSDENNVSMNGSGDSKNVLIDDLIFLKDIKSSTARQIAEMENGDMPFECPKCETERRLSSIFSLDNSICCSSCNWSGKIYEGVINILDRTSGPGDLE